MLVDIAVRLPHTYMGTTHKDLEDMPHVVGADDVELVALGEDGRVGQRRQLVLARRLEFLEGRIHVRIGLAGGAHHGPVQRFGVDGWYGGHLRRVFDFEFLTLELGPHFGPFEVGFEAAHEIGVVGDLAALEFVPGPVGGVFPDRVVDVAFWNAVFDFVVEDRLERGDDL